MEENSQTRLKLAYVKLSGRYGEDRSWWKEVTTVDGIVKISRDAPPSPTPVITAGLWTEEAVYGPGDMHTLYYSLQPNSAEDVLASIKADVYLLLVAPGGGMFWFEGGTAREKQLSRRVAPALKYPAMGAAGGVAEFFRDGDGRMMRREGLAVQLPMGDTMPGTYRWYGAIVLSGESPFDTSSHLSNIADAAFEVR